jgi:hypothetical protein
MFSTHAAGVKIDPEEHRVTRLTIADMVARERPG